MGGAVAVRRLGAAVRYGRGLELQAALAGALRATRAEAAGQEAAAGGPVAAGGPCCTLLVLQHTPVFTVGRRGLGAGELRTPGGEAGLGAELVRVPRGGQVTFHGPGQLVLYPVTDLRRLGLGARRFVEGLEDVMVAAAAEFGVEARGRQGGNRTGVWSGDRKLGAVGVQISQGISTHGLAFNVGTELTYFDKVVPCGLEDAGVMTSLNRELGRELPLGSVENSLVRHFGRVFGLELIEQRGAAEFSGSG